MSNIRYKITFVDRDGKTLGTFHIVSDSESKAREIAIEKFGKPYAKMYSRRKEREHKWS